MKRHLKKFFIPHEENNYHPHVLHTKRAIFYTLLFLGLKCWVFLFALMLPSVVFVMPDILEQEENKLFALTNALRLEHGLPALTPAPSLEVSASLKSTDMAKLGYFSHVNPDNQGLPYFLSEAGYPYDVAGENLALGFSSAEDVFHSWVQSPTHYANLLDPEFTQSGIAMESGSYGNVSTVYVTEHFAKPKAASELSFPISKTRTELAFSPSLSSSREKDQEKTVSLSNSVQVIASQSFVEWKESKNTTNLFAQAKIEGEVQSVFIILGKYSFPLLYTGEGIYRGTFMAPEHVDNFFNPVVLPSLEVIDEKGVSLKTNIDWKQVKIVAASPLEKYMKAKEIGGLSHFVFAFVRGVYLFFALFFSVALLLSIFIHIRKQHHHITLQTFCLILLLISLFLV